MDDTTERGAGASGSARARRDARQGPRLLVVAGLIWLGPDHRLLVPGSACCGAGLMIAADLIARTATAPAELPVGIVTAAVGAPFFLWLLVRHRQAVFA